MGTAELTEDQDGGDEGRRGARAEEPEVMTRSTSPELHDETCGDREHEVGPGQPSESREQAWPERVRDRGPESVSRLGATRDVVRERPSDEGGKDDRDADEPDDEHTERAESSGDLTARGPGQGSDGGPGRGRQGHPPVVMPLTSVADSVTDRARLPTPMMPRSWVGIR